MGTTMLFQVPGSLFNIAQLLKDMELGQCCLSGPTASFERICPRRSGSPKVQNHTVRCHLRIGR
jgi:hypothetical protein